MNKKNKYRVALLIFTINLLIHLSIMGHYPVSWDFHYHHYAGLFHLGLPVPKANEPSQIPFTPPDPRLTIEDPFGPFTQILPTLSYVIFFQNLKVLPFDAAYNLPMVISGSLGPALLFLFLHDLSGFLAAVFGAAFLSLLPVHFGYLHTNMKDIPNALAFTLSVYAFYKLVIGKKITNLITAVVSFAVAFNVKINSVMIPVVCGVWYALTIILSSKRKFQILTISYFFLAPLAAVALWWPFWKDPLGKLLELPVFYSRNTLNMPVLFNGNILRSGVNIPPVYPYYYLAVTTPIPILITFIIGIVYIIYSIKKRNTPLLLLLVWFFIPLARYLSPKTGAIDGVRHFLEVVYPVTAIAAVGAGTVTRLLLKTAKTKYLVGILWTAVLATLIKNIVVFHPYQTSFFNGLIGGIRGAQGKLDIDFWATPQKEAVDWLNQNAQPNAKVYIVMAPGSAAAYLRPDLLEMVNTADPAQSDYIVILNRESFFTIYNVRELLPKAQEEGRVVYARTVNGVPLVWVLKKSEKAS